MRIQDELIDFLARKRLANRCCDFALVSFYGLKHMQLYISEVVLIVQHQSFFDETGLFLLYTKTLFRHFYCFEM